MSTEVATRPPDVSVIEKVILAGDLKDLKPNERLSHYNSVCESLGLNPLTQPFAYLNLSGKMVLYARKDAAEQLRYVRHVSCRITSTQILDGVYVVTATAALPSGREDSSTGAVAIEGLKGEARANAMMKAETKAKRRVTLSICGLGMMDETEVDTIPDARPVTVTQAHAQIAAPAEAKQEPLEVNRGTGRKVPEELMVCVDKVRKFDYADFPIACAMLERETKELGIGPAYTNRAAGLRASYPKGTPIPPEVREGFLLDVWGEIEAMRLRRAGENAPEPKTGDKADWLPDFDSKESV